MMLWSDERRRWLVHRAVRSLQPDAHGSAIAEWTARATGTSTPTAVLFGVLDRMVAAGYLRSRTEICAPGRERRFFETTGKHLAPPPGIPAARG